jgi:homoserine dehydrogenase
MKKHYLSCEEVLKSIQEAGYDEDDPPFDVMSTSLEFAMLASLAWVNWIKVKNISVIKGIAYLDMS